MEKESKRASDKVEDAKRLCSDSQSRLDEYLSGSDGDAETVGLEEQDDEGHLRGARVGELNQPGEGRGYSDVSMGSDDVRCKILDSRRRGHPCWNCRGGSDFEACKRIRGVKK